MSSCTPCWMCSQRTSSSPSSTHESQSSLIIQETLAGSDADVCTTGVRRHQIPRSARRVLHTHKGLMTSRSIKGLEFLKKGSLPERKVPSRGRSVLLESVCEASVWAQ